MPRTAAAVTALLLLHAALAVLSLVQENPTVDEVAHLPAGITYWERGTFRLYHHNPPLIKLIAALPVVASRPATADLYHLPSWRNEPPDQATFAHAFAWMNAARYFELFTRARLLMPLFSVLGGLVVFAWSRRLYGNPGGLLSLTLWCLCPNVLAHGRLVTTDLGATALGVAATYLFLRFLQRPGWLRAAGVGVGLGLAELAKFSMVLLYGLWPLLWAIRAVWHREPGGFARRLARAAGQGLLMGAVSLLVIDAGYGLERIGRPLGRFGFACRLLTRPKVTGPDRPRSRNPLYDGAWRYRVNRFRGTVLEGLPVPLPEQYLLGFDEQKLESEGVPEAYLLPEGVAPSRADLTRTLTYPVYLDGELRRQGWWYYYLAALAYKVPEGTWLLGLLAVGVAVTARGSRAAPADELTLAIVPAVFLGVMSFGTNINLGLRYILPAFPYAFIFIGKLAPWAAGLPGRWRGVAVGATGACLALTAAATATIHPHYLAYFNWVSGGRDRGSEHLIDSNLDWGQDLVNLARWVHEHAPNERIGLAYFGQINPTILNLRGEGFSWFVPPTAPDALRPMPGRFPREGPAPQLVPGLYAVSASLVRGLSWRLYDPAPEAFAPAWNASEKAYSYFAPLTPVARIGGSIFVYRLTPEAAAKLGHRIGSGGY